MLPSSDQPSSELEPIADAAVVKTPTGTDLWFEVNGSRYQMHIEHDDYRLQARGQKALAALRQAIGADLEDTSDIIGKRVALDDLAKVLVGCTYVPPDFARGATAPTSSSRSRYVYVMSCIGSSEPLCKIGIASAPESRAKTIATASPHPIRVEFMRHCGDAGRAEAEAHKLFAKCRRNGEWFAVEPSVAIRQVNSIIEQVNA